MGKGGFFCVIGVLSMAIRDDAEQNEPLTTSLSVNELNQQAIHE